MNSTVDSTKLRIHITYFSIIVCLGVCLINAYEYFALSGLKYKLGMAIVMSINISLFVLSLIVKQNEKKSTMLFLAVAPITYGGILIFESPSAVFVTSTAALALLMFLPDILSPDMISHRDWLGILGFTGILAFGNRLLLRGADFAPTVFEGLVIVFGSLSLLAMLWLAIRMILKRLSNALISSEKLRAQLNLALKESERLQATLVEQNQELKHTNETKSRFLANMSHELRTPLNAIIGYSEMIVEEMNDEGNTDHIWYDDISRIQTSGQHLLTIISNILDISKIEAGHVEVHLSKIDISTLCTSLNETCLPLFSKNNNQFEYHIQDDINHIETDQTKLYQILLNLLSNAAKFTQNGEISLTIGQSTKPNFIQFIVEDNGIGIQEEHLEHIFEAFTQADGSTTRKYGGTGLGLTLVQEFVQHLGGTVEVYSTFGSGSKFVVLLPHHPSAS